MDLKIIKRYPKDRLLFDPKEKSLRRRLDSHVTRVIETTFTRTDPPQHAIDGAMALCEEEYNRFDTDPTVADHGIFQTISRKDTRRKHLTDTLLNLYWRTRKQTAVFEVFCILYEHGLFSAEALALPIEYQRTTTNLRNIYTMLCCFPNISDFDEPPLIHGEQILHFFDLPIQWLAVMVCRSCYNMDAVNEVIGLINQSQILGRLDMTAVEEVNEERASAVQSAIVKSKEQGARLPKAKGKGKGKQRGGSSAPGTSTPKVSEKDFNQELTPLLQWNPNENVAEKVWHHSFGLVLPSGLGSDIRQLFDDANTRFVAIENVFVAYFRMTAQELGLDDEY